jgi:O-antigen/teichoic acid export membrane protein
MLKVLNNIKDERYRKASLTAIFSIVTQAVVILTSLVTVPLVLNYVGVEKFGIWMTLTTGLSFIAFSDFGIGIGTQDKMAKYYGLQNYTAVRNSFYTSFIFVNFVITLLMIASLFFYHYVPFQEISFFKKINNVDEVNSLIIIVIAIFILGIVAGIVIRAYNALQQGFFISAIQLFSRIVTLVLLYLIVYLKGSFELLVFTIGGLPYIFIIVIGLPALLIKFSWLKFKSLTEVVDINLLKEILKVGFWGLGASIAIYFVNNIIILILSTNFSLQEVARFAILQRLISIPIMLLSFATIPLWPAITEAKAKKDFVWIKSLINKINLISIGFMVLFSFTYFFAVDKVIELWLNNNALVPDRMLLISVILFMVVSFWNSNLTLILNGLSLYKSQAIVGLLLSVGFGFLAFKIPNSLGVEWVVYCITIGYFLRCLYMYFEIKKVTKNLLVKVE